MRPSTRALKSEEASPEVGIGGPSARVVISRGKTRCWKMRKRDLACEHLNILHAVLRKIVTAGEARVY